MLEVRWIGWPNATIVGGFRGCHYNDAVQFESVDVSSGRMEGSSVRLRSAVFERFLVLSRAAVLPSDWRPRRRTNVAYATNRCSCVNGTTPWSHCGRQAAGRRGRNEPDQGEMPDRENGAVRARRWPDSGRALAKAGMLFIEGQKLGPLLAQGSFALRDRLDRRCQRTGERGPKHASVHSSFISERGTSIGGIAGCSRCDCRLRAQRRSTQRRDLPLRVAGTRR